MKKKATASQSGLLGGRLLVGFLVCAGIMSLVIARTSPATAGKAASLYSEAPANTSQRTLTFAERVSYQRAIEEVYWRYRIWPKDNPNPKPTFDAAISQAALEKKVQGYLRESQALEDYWYRAITAQQLQAEMERMARHTKQPEVLRELFQALGNDPFVTAECLARPLLAERLLASEQLTQARRNQEQVITDSGNYTLPSISHAGACTDDTWTATPISPAARDRHTAVWTGTEMIVWGGENLTGYGLNTGGRYNPSTDSWTATNLTNAPAARADHTAVWTGTEMIVWGGVYVNQNIGTVFNTGGRYNPDTDSWTATSTANAPAGRYAHTAVWTGSEMIVWGGTDLNNLFNTGGRYNPSTDSWSVTSTANAPDPRNFHTAVWAGDQMIVWGGCTDPNFCGEYTGGRYNPVTNSWTATSLTNAPSPRAGHTAVWTGSEMIIWGAHYHDGGRYDPSTDSWTATSTINAPDDRHGNTAVWTGSDMIVWGGFQFSNLNTGGKYNPATDSWVATSTTNAPQGRLLHTAVWTGSEMIVWGGHYATPNGGPFLNTGGRYCAPFSGSQLGNISTRAFVQTGDNVMIGGFIVQGPATKRVIIRAIGPELTRYGVPNALPNPMLELHDATGALIASNNDWATTIIGGIITANQVREIQASGHAPRDGRESAIIADLPPGNYTAIVRGVNDTMGVALAEVYDLNADANSILGNISTRALVQTGDDVMIGGFMVEGTQPRRVIVRAIGPELSQFGVPDPLSDPTLELHDSTGALIASNNNWVTTIIGGIITANQVRDIRASGHAPSDGRESAIIADLPPGNYTAIMRGVSDTTGVGLVEVYDLY